jgi:flagellar hook-associated protein 2
MTTTSTTATTGATTGSTALTTPVSIAGTSSTAASNAAGGSVINVSTLVSELVAAAQAPQQQLITNQTTAVTANISAVGTLKSALSTFQSALTALSTPSNFNSVTATSADDTLVSATASGEAVPGSYAVTVSNLASAQQILSGAFLGGGSATVGTGTLSLSVGGSSVAVTINSADDTLSGIANAINSAANNPGITASVIQGTDGGHLLLSSSLTGAANTLSVTETDGGNGLAALTYGSGNTGHYTQNAAASDASFSVAGVPYTSSSNNVSDAISGVTLDLLGVTGSGTGTGTGTSGTVPSSVNVTVGSDTSTVATNIQSFVTAYNTAQAALAGLGSYDATTGTAGQLLGNPVLTGVENQIQNALYSQVGSSAYNTLASIGITTNADGSLSVNSATLNNALSTNFSAVSQLFSGANGVATQLNTQITAALGSDGSITNYTSTLTQQNTALQNQTTTLDNQMTALSATLTQQYATLNTLLSSLQSTSAYLTQAFNSLPTVQGTPNA